MESSEGRDQEAAPIQQEGEGRVEDGEQSVCSVDTGIELEVLRLGYPGYKALVQPNIDVEEIEKHILMLAASMTKTMYNEPGIGLAAPQVGININMIVIDPIYDPSKEDTRKPVVMINPKFLELSDDMFTDMEACLSVPNIQVPIKRHDACTIAFTDLGNNLQVFELEGLLARVMQHEMDHLDGKLIIDYLSSLQRKMYVKSIFKPMRKALKMRKRMEKHANSIRASKGRVARPSSPDVQPVIPEGVGIPTTSGDGDGAGDGEARP